MWLVTHKNRFDSKKKTDVNPLRKTRLRNIINNKGNIVKSAQSLSNLCMSKGWDETTYPSNHPCVSLSNLMKRTQIFFRFIASYHLYTVIVHIKTQSESKRKPTIQKYFSKSSLQKYLLESPFHKVFQNVFWNSHLEDNYESRNIFQNGCSG